MPVQRLETTRERLGDTNRVEEEKNRSGGASESAGEEKRKRIQRGSLGERVGDDVLGTGKVTGEVANV